MNGILNANQLTIVKNYETNKSLVHKIDSIVDNCIRDFHHRYFHTFEYRCVYNNILTNTANNERNSLPVPDKSLGLCELNTKLKIGRQRSFVFIQIIKLTKKNW